MHRGAWQATVLKEAFIVVKTLKMRLTLLRNFEVHNILLLAMCSKLYARFLELIHFV